MFFFTKLSRFPNVITLLCHSLFDVQDGRAVLDKMLAKTPELMEGLIEIAYQRKWLETTYASIRFAQYIIQGLWPTASNGNTNHFLMQLPHVTTEDVKLFNKGPKAPKTMTDFLKLSDDDVSLTNPAASLFLLPRNLV